MYNINLYEGGVFCTAIGGPIPTLPDAIKQLRDMAAPLKAEELNGYLGYRFDRGGTECQIVVADKWGAPIVNVQNED